MEDFVLSNIDRYRELVQKFQPKENEKSDVGAAASRDMLVSTRIRPLSEEEMAGGLPEGAFLRPSISNTVDVHELKKGLRGPPTLKSTEYQVDHAYGPESTTEQIYDEAVKHLVPWAWVGGIGTLFAYGQTGSGKTFTISGLEKLVAKQLMSGEMEEGRKVYISIIELAGNSAHDLLNSRRSVSIMEDSFGVTQLAGALEKHVSTEAEVLDLIETATLFRRTEATQRNDTSSRSHAICRIRIEISSIPGAEDGVLYLVDLAGSEAARDREAHGADRMRETREINSSLSVLKDCIRGKTEADALLGAATKRKPHVPFRQSALTKVLKHVFDPAGARTSKTVVMACVNPCLLDIQASRNTLKYAEMLRVFLPKTKAVKHDPKQPMTWTNEQLREWIDQKSGIPAISSSILAPEETGMQLLRLPGPEFELRCLKTPGVTLDQARTFKSRLWQFHVDSQRAKAIAPNAGESTEPDTILGHFAAADRSSSIDRNPKAASVPFKERLRPGMVIRWKRPRYFHIGLAGDSDLAIILSPLEAVGTELTDAANKPINAKCLERYDVSESSPKYLCSVVTPGLMHTSYDINIWRHLVVAVEWMESEVHLEFDPGSRYYYMAL